MIRILKNGAIFGVMALSLSGCRDLPATEKQLQRGLIFMFPGIEGGRWSLGEARRGFRDARADQAIETMQWTYPFSPFQNLMDYRNNQELAHQAAGQIADYTRQWPGRPVDLVGYSGGGGLAVLTVEALPPGVRVRNVILVHAAISPDYDLTGALEHMDGKVVNLYSRWDWFMVGVGTTVFGTIDRKHTASAGMVGFDLARACPREEWQGRIVQQPWSPGQIKQGRWGGHLAISFYEVNRQFVAPYLVIEETRGQQASQG